MKELKAGVLLSLKKDQYSRGMKDASTDTSNFSAGAIKAIDKVNGAMSGMAGKLGALGVTLGFGAAVKASIDLDDRLVRIGTDAGASAEEVNKFRRQLYDVARAPDIKMDTAPLLDAVEVLTGKAIGLEFVEENIRSIALAMKATGISGEEAGNAFAVFEKLGYSSDEILSTLDQMAVIADTAGGFGLSKFTQAMPGLMEMNSTIGDSSEDLIKLYNTMQILGKGTKDEAKAVEVYNAMLTELSDPRKQELLHRQLGIQVRDKDTQQFRDFGDIMNEIAASKEKWGNLDVLGTVFSSAAMDAVRAYDRYGDLDKKLTDLGDTTNAVQKRAAQNSASLKSNLNNLQTAFLAFADKNLTGPLEKLTEFLNKLAEDPEKVEKYIRNITIALGALAAVKIGAGIVSFIGNLKGLQGGAKIDLTGAAGTNGMPVYVTNWGGTAGASPIPNLGGGGIPGLGNTPAGKPAGTPLGGPKINPGTLGKAGVAGAAMAAVVAVPQMIGELNEIDQNEELTKKERNKAKGGAIGGAVGSIGGTAAGAIAGAAIGSVVPVVGTAIGALVGGAIGYFGGKLGRMAGEAIGEAITKEDLPSTLSEEMQSIEQIPQGQGGAVLEGNAQIENHVYIHEDRVDVQSRVVNNSMPVQFPTGSYREYRGLTP